MHKIYLICGVPGSGKTWILRHFTDDNKVQTVHYDHHFSTPRIEYANKLLNASKESVVIADCPLGVSEIIMHLKGNGALIEPIFVIEDAKTVEERYIQRENKPIPKQHLSRIKTMKQRAVEYQAKTGKSSEILEYLLNQLK